MGGESPVSVAAWNKQGNRRKRLAPGGVTCNQSAGAIGDSTTGGQWNVNKDCVIDVELWID